MEVAGPLGTPLGLAQRKRASPRGEVKCSLGISDFLEEISNLSHSVVFLYFFALIAGEGFLGVAFQSHPVGHTSSRVEAKNSTILSSRDA